MMKNFHLSSFLTGIAAGIVILAIFLGGQRMFGSSSSSTFAGVNGQGRTMNLDRMAQRLGISKEEIQKEMAAGKTLQQIAKEHNVQLPSRGQRGGSGATVSSMTSGTGSSSMTSSLSQ